MKHYEQIYDGEWFDWDRRNNRDQCCDCGLVHRVDLRIVKRGTKTYIQERAYRDDKATAGIRKRAGIKITRKK